VFQQLGDWAVTLIALPVFLSLAAGLSFLVYRKFGDYDSVTAFYASMPGGLNEMLIMGAEAGGDERRIALAHAARVLIVIFFVVVFFWLVLGVTSTGSAGWVALDALTVFDYVILTACAVLGLFIGKALRLPAAPIFGPMLLSGIAHLVGWVTVAPPTVFIIGAQLVIGTVIGARFVGTSPREVAKDLSLAVVSALGMLIIAVGFAEAIALQSGMDLSQAFLAFSPGGLTEMSLLSLSMGQEVAYVSSIHLIRITVVIAIAPYVFRRVMRR
jgi:membrane AbrB-like protein